MARKRKIKFGGKTIFSQSAIKTFNECPMKYLYRYDESIEKIGKPENMSFTFGTLFHTLFEMKVAGSSFPEKENYKFVKDFEKLKAANPYDAAKLMAIKDVAFDYFDFFKPERYEKIKKIKTEVEFIDQIVNPETGGNLQKSLVSGKIDGLFFDGNDYSLIENKTVSAGFFNSSYIDKLQMDFQINLYTAIVSKMVGVPVQNVVYNIIAKPSIIPLKANKRRDADETPGEYYARCCQWYIDKEESAVMSLKIYLDAGQQRDALNDLFCVAKSINEKKRRNLWNKNMQNCYTYNSPCEYLSLCAACGSELLKQQTFQGKEKHSELDLDESKQNIELFEFFKNS